MPWSLARGCFRTGKLERSPARCPRKTSLWRSGKGSVWQVRQLMIFRFGILFLFSFSDTSVSRLCAGSFSHPLFTVSSKSLSCKERHHGWDGTLDLHGCCCRWVLWLIVSWLALLFLAGNSVIVWLFAVVYIFSLYYWNFIIGALSAYSHCNFFVFSVCCCCCFFFFFFFLLLCPCWWLVFLFS